jgi:glucose-6-phosphate 1-dehydrogenase
VSADQQTLLILGATGDLTKRLLLPGLGGLLAAGHGERLSLIGSSRADLEPAGWRERVTASLANGNAPRERAEALVASTCYIQADAGREDDLRRLLDVCHGGVVIFFALGPEITVRACEALTGIELPPGTRLVLEKPFGTDAASATALNDLLARLVPEDQIFRVDHYLGMSTVVNILGLRFANRMLEPVLLRPCGRPDRHDPEPLAAGSVAARDGSSLHRGRPGRA